VYGGIWALEQIVLQTAAASGRRDGSIRYWASVGPGDFSFLPDGCECRCRRGWELNSEPKPPTICFVLWSQPSRVGTLNPSVS
jgi:hypothetical protein